jgi:hypothetical protein
MNDKKKEHNPKTTLAASLPKPILPRLDWIQLALGINSIIHHYDSNSSTATELKLIIEQESLYTVDQLQKIVTQQDEKNDIDKLGIMLLQVLAERWDRIKSTNLCYNCDTQSLGNLCCFYISVHMLMELKNAGITTCLFQILMPTITDQGKKDPIAGISLSDKDFHLPSITLSDDNTRIIAVFERIAEVKHLGKLRDNWDSIIPLSESEKRRIIHRSTESEEYYSVMLEYYNYQAFSLYHLLDDFRKSLNCCDLRSAPQSNNQTLKQTILSFQKTLNNLTNGQREIIFACENEMDVSFGELWKESFEKYLSAVTYESIQILSLSCLTHAQITIDSILETNQQLRSTTVINSARYQEIIAKEEKIKQKIDKFIKTKSFHINDYGSAGDEHLITNVHLYAKTLGNTNVSSASSSFFVSSFCSSSSSSNAQKWRDSATNLAEQKKHTN